MNPYQHPILVGTVTTLGGLLVMLASAPAAAWALKAVRNALL